MTVHVPRPVYMIRLRPEPHVDGIRALRATLKILGRRFGLKALEVREENPPAVDD